MAIVILFMNSIYFIWNKMGKLVKSIKIMEITIRKKGKLFLPMHRSRIAFFKALSNKEKISYFRVPEEKQTMFLPNIMEEEENTTGSATPRTSSASLAAHNDSPAENNKR
jgi:hypothetical protein